MQQVKAHQDHRRCPLCGSDLRGTLQLRAILQRVEGGSATRIQGHDLPIEEHAAAGLRRQIRRQLRKEAREVEAAARLQAHLVLIDEGQNPIAVKLRLIAPARIRGRCRAALGQHRSQPAGERLGLAREGRARDLEDRLSDTLHQSLTQRFVDRRTSALLRSLSQRAGSILSGIDADGTVTVEGHLVGKLAGFHFEPERGASALENRALRGAVERVVAPEVVRRLGALASEGDEAFALAPGGVVNWRGEAAGEIVGGEPFAPRVRLDWRIRRRAAARARRATPRSFRRR